MNSNSNVSRKPKTTARSTTPSRPSGHGVAYDVAVKRMRGIMQSDEITFEIAELFKAFGDSTRVRILNALQSGELCVGALAEALGMTHSAISHQLRLLKQMRLIRSRKEGKSVFYTLNDDHIHLIFALAYEHVTERRK